MARFISPGSIRNGKVANWSGAIETPEEYIEVRKFIEYTEQICNKYLRVEESIVTEDIRIEKRRGVVYLTLVMYDRVLEKVLRNTEKGEKEDCVRQAIGGRLMIIKRLLYREGKRYFGMPVEIEFKGLGFRDMNGVLLSRYIAVCIEKGYSILDVVRLISKEYRPVGGSQTTERGNKLKSKNSEVDLDLKHRYTKRGGNNVRGFKAVEVGGVNLLGYRIDLAGRFSRKQRAGKKSIREGKVPLGSFKGYLDYGMSTAVLEYGVSSIRVWKYYDKKPVESINLREKFELDKLVSTLESNQLTVSKGIAKGKEVNKNRNKNYLYTLR